ncbi:MAG: DinB family protein [Chloroflexi bacterium]|nr:DinB family protein [Chloroflexota bacterium]MBI3040938.1 DinB family protein [Chloroflexota bacterium]
MEAREVILRSLEQSQSYLTRALAGLTQEEAVWCPATESNSIAFIFWHMTRVEDFFVNRVIQRRDVLYEAEGWREKLGTPVQDTGYGYTAEQLQAWPVPKLEVMRGYAKSVREKTLAFLKSVTPQRLSELARPDRPPDTVGAILTRITTEIALHVGQIAYLRGAQRGLEHLDMPDY